MDATGGRKSLARPRSQRKHERPAVKAEKPWSVELIQQAEKTAR